MPTNVFGADALAKAAREELDAVPKESAHVGVVAQKGDVGVEGAVSKTFGDDGAFVEAQGSWYVRQGYKFAAWIGWKGGSK